MVAVVTVYVTDTNKRNSVNHLFATTLYHQSPPTKSYSSSNVFNNAVISNFPIQIHASMTALQAISSRLLSIHDDDPPSPPSSDFQFESDYVKSLLKERRTPSPIIVKPSSYTTTSTTSSIGKENLDRWKTPVTIGAHAGRQVLGQRDLNSRVIAESTPGVKLSS